MKILIGIGHPAHVHFYRNAIKIWEESGENVCVVSKPRALAVTLLEKYGIDYVTAGGKNHRGNFSDNLLYSFSRYEWGVLKKVYNFQPDVVTGICNVPLSHASFIFDCRSIIFTDTEHAKLQNTLSFPFADEIWTPDCYQGDIGSNHYTYSGYHELAYLHPERFEPDPDILDEIEVETDRSLVVLRLVSWDAVHDIGDSGLENITEVVRELEATGATVLVTSEAPLPEELESRRVNIAPHRIHHLLYFADLFVGEGATMAAESAVLGTPSVFISSIRLGYTDELEEKYGLVFNYSGAMRQENGIQKAVSILEEYDSSDWQQKREQLLADKIDTTSVIVNRIKNTNS